MSIKDLFKKAVDPKTLTNRSQKRKQTKIDRQMPKIEKEIFAKVEIQRQKNARLKAIDARHQKVHEQSIARKKKLGNVK